MNNFRKKLLTTSLIGVLALATVPMSGCGEQTKATLDRVGAVSTILTRGFNDQIAALKAAGADPAKIAVWERAGRGLTVTTDALRDYLDSLKEVNEKNAAEVVQKVGAALNIVQELLKNPDILALGEDSKLVQILRWSSIGFNQAAITIGILFPAPQTGTASFSLGGGSGRSIPKEKIHLSLPKPPPAVEELLKKG